MFDDRLEKLRKNLGYSMRQMAGNLGMKYTTYVNYEKDIREPDSETLILFSKYFGVTVDYLLGLSEIKNAPKLETQMTSEISELADAYTKHPEMHHAIRILLGLDEVTHSQTTQISSNTTEPQPQVKVDTPEEKILTFKRIARKDGESDTVTMTQAEFDDIMNQPEPDF